MNGVGLKDPERGNPLAVEAFADQVRAFLDSCVDLYAWAGSIVLSHLATLGYPPGEDVNLDTYLTKARRRKLSAGEAFRSLLGSALPREEADLIAELCEDQSAAVQKERRSYGTWRRPNRLLTEIWKPDRGLFG
jgi:hypothetical protein